MSIFSSYKKIFLLGFIIVILIAIPLSVYIAQQRQRTTSQAAKSTVLSFEPAQPTIKVGETLTLNVVLDPTSGSTANQVSFAKLIINFDPSKFTTVAGSLAPNPNSPNTLTSVLEDAAYTSGTASISLSIGADPTKVLTTKANIAILKLKALSQTDSNNPSSITFDQTTQVLSIAASDRTSENVLSTTSPAIVTINSMPSAPSSVSSISPITPTVTTTPSSTPLSSVTGTPSSPFQTAETTELLETKPVTIELTPTIEPQVLETLPIAQTLPPVGPSENILGIGILGAIFTIIGGVLFILL